jgi:SAM-dependent methyltransferase
LQTQSPLRSPPHPAPSSITWLGATHRHILVGYGPTCYAVPVELGSWDITAKALQTNPRILTAMSLDDLQQRARDAERPSNDRPSSAVRAGSVSGFDLYDCGSRCCAVPEAHQFEVARFRARRYSHCLIAHTMRDLRDEIARRTSTGRFQGLVLQPPTGMDWEALLARLGDVEPVVLATTPVTLPGGVEVIRHEVDFGDERPNPQRERLLAELRARNFDFAVLACDGAGWLAARGLERLAAAVCNRFLLLLDDGKERFYRGEDIHRLCYNKAYLTNMINDLPPLAGKRVLEFGASDGLACDLVALLGPEQVVGVDVDDLVGCGYPNPAVSYQRSERDVLPFDDDSFDVVFSIATLEHVRSPLAAIREMLRVARPGGYCYLQAGPLYFSAYGHHMFGCFDDLPWIHLRVSREEIVDEACRRGLDAAFREEGVESVAQYVNRMLHPQHLNGRLWSEYGLEMLGAQDDVRVKALRRSCEGDELLTPEILLDTYPIGRADLTAHGFELVIEKTDAR